MAISNVVGLKASLVLLDLRLLTSADEFTAFRTNLDREVVKQGAPAIVIGPVGLPQAPDPADSFELRLEQERIAIKVSPRGTEIEQEYPREGLDELSAIATACIQNSSLADSGPSAFGYNLDIRCAQDSGVEAGRYLAERLLRAGLVSWGNTEGVSFTIAVKEEDALWTFTLEPRLREEGTHALFAKTNYHFDRQRIPSPEDIENALTTLWQRTVKLIEDLDGNA